MNSRQNQRTMPGRGSVLLVSFPSLYKRSSSPPLIVTPGASSAITNQFVRLGDSNPTGQHGRSPSSKVLRENNSFLNANGFRNNAFAGNKKSLSALDLRAAQRILHDSGRNLLPRKENLILTDRCRTENGSRSLNKSTGANLPSDKNTYAHGSILKKSAFKNQPEDYESGYIDEELLSAMRSKRKVLFKNKVSVFRFDSDGGGGSSECDRRATRNQTPQNPRRYRTMTPKAALSPNRNPTTPTSTPSLRFLSPFQRHVVVPSKPRAPSAMREESFYLVFGDDAAAKGENVSSMNVGRRPAAASSSSTSTVTSDRTISQQQNQYESIDSIPSSSSSRASPGTSAYAETSADLDVASVSNSIASSRSSRDATGSKIPKPSRQSGRDDDAEGLEKQTQKEAKFAYHVASDTNKLVISVRLGLTLHPNDVLVKANKIGTKLRIVANPESNASQLKLNEQIMLPVHVDPYRLSAKIDQTGNLLIEAPVSK